MAKRILVVDDSAIMREQIRRIIELQKGIEVCAEADDGAEAVRKVEECHPDLVILDFLMPGMNGLEATRRIRQLEPRLPILMFTLHQNAQFEHESELAGADAVLPKAEGARLLSVISQLLH